MDVIANSIADQLPFVVACAVALALALGATLIGIMLNPIRVQE